MKTLGVDIGGTNIDIVMLSDGRYKHIMTFSTKNIDDACEEILKIASMMDVDAVGIGAAVWLRGEKAIHAPNLPSPEIPLRLKEELRKDLNVPTFIDNDANCFALFARETLGYENLLAVTVGTGIGSGIVINGKIYRGNGLAGEIGHWKVGTGMETGTETGTETRMETETEKCRCGGFNHLECYFSGWSIEKKYGKSVKELMAERKDFIYKIKGFEVFCEAIANAIMLLDPSAVVFGGRIGAQFDSETLAKSIYRHLMRGFSPKIEVLRDEIAVAKGACLLAAFGSAELV